MSQENVEIVRRVYDRVTATKRLSLDLFAADFELDVSEVSPVDASVLRGISAAEGALGPYWRTFDDFHTEIEEVVHADETRVVTVVRDTGRISGSDAKVSNRFFHVFTLSAGKIGRQSIHTQRERALEAAGLAR